MVSINIERESLFGDESEEDDIPRIAPLPDLDNGDNAEGQLTEEATAPEGDGQGNLDGVLRDLSKGAAKKRVAKPQPKLDGERLKSDKGLPALQNLFVGVNFKGVGHEAEDLDIVMRKLEHWAHRLFPKLKFDEFIERMERLGSKREVQTCVKRIRMDMAINDNDILNRKDDSDGDDDVQQRLAGASTSLVHQASYMSSDDELDAIASNPIQQVAPLPADHQAVNTPSFTEPASQQPSNSSAAPTADQLERIERNKRLALERRAAKLGVSVESLS